MCTKTIDKQFYTVFSQKLAGYLMLRGFVLVAMRPDKKGSGRNVFFFNDTPQINIEVNKYNQYVNNK